VKIVFIDTSAWLALINKSGEFHEKAKLVRNGLIEKNAKFVMTDYIIVEIANCLSRIPFREAAIKLIESIRNSEDIEVVRVNEEIFERLGIYTPVGKTRNGDSQTAQVLWL